MNITRHFTTPATPGSSVFDTVEWTTRSSRISNMDGSVVFEMKDAHVPKGWSQLATDIMVSKYFRKAGVPQEEGTEARRHEGTKGGEDGGSEPACVEPGSGVEMGPERSARQVIHRLAGCWRHWGESHGYFDSAEDAQAFYDELCHMMLHQMAAPNSPQWFNTGLHWAYGLAGPAQGQYRVDPADAASGGPGEAEPTEDAYTHPAPHACHILSVDDDLVNEGGIMDLWVREARIFKYGAGAGVNVSSIRSDGESLSGGGTSSGLMSFLKVGDRAAGAIKSGGTTRRAALMRVLDLDHPDVPTFINWKVREELKVAALVEGMKHLDAEQRETALRLGLELTYDFNGEAYSTVSGQNSNNSVRIPHSFFEALDNDGSWDMIRRTDGKLARSVPARDLWEQIGYAAWRCADPGVQYDTNINDWHTCPSAGKIRASNPCSEYLFVDNTSCNLASLNLLKFYNSESREFDIEGYEHAVRLWTVVLEISVLMAALPSKITAERTYRFRTLGLGYANLGAMLMQAGIPYDSDRGRAICGTLTAILTGRSYAASAEMAKQMGPFDGFADDRENMLRVMRNHRRAAYGVARVGGEGHALGEYEALSVKPVPIDAEAAVGGGDAAVGVVANAATLVERARACWDDALSLGERHGYRNAQATVLAPTGTIGLLMDCDTTGVEPDFALVKFKKLAGGGYFKIANASLRPALEALGYNEREVREILEYVLGRLTLDVGMGEGGDADGLESVGFAEWLVEKGLEEEDLAKVTAALPTVFELQHAFNAWTLGEAAIERLGLTAKAKEGAAGFSVLRELGLSKRQVADLNRVICGTQTVEGAPHLRAEHLPVFDCANTCGPTGERFIEAGGHIRMMAAAQPFISGAISKTINLPNSASVDDIKSSYRLSWALGLKANALYRDGCKLSQPLSNKAEGSEADVDDDEMNVEAGREAVAADVAELAGASAKPQAEADIVRERVVERIVERPLRRRLPDTRRSVTHKFNVAGHEGYLTVGLYEDGTPGELFITMAKEGSTIGGLMDSLGTAISVALQYGVPTESLVTKFSHQRFEPAGMSRNPEIPFAKSLVDYIFRWMGMEFVPGYREANAPRRGGGDEAEIAVDKPRAGAVAEVGRMSEPRRVEWESRESNGGGRRLEFDSPARSPRPSGEMRAQLVRGPALNKAAAESGSGIDTALAAAMKEMQADAPACDVCGTITVRNGTCYRCMNCGASMGCS